MSVDQWTQPIYEAWDQKTAKGQTAAVSAHHPHACSIALSMLNQGGHAVDAAVAAAFALSVLEPWASGLGGGGYMTIYSAQTQSVEVIDFQMPTPKQLDPRDFVADEGVVVDIFSWPKLKGEKNRHGVLSTCIPGAVSGYGLAHKRHGQLPWSDVLAPSLALAKQGHLITGWTAIKTAEQAHLLREYPEAAKQWLPHGLPVTPSESLSHTWIDHSQLASTIKRLAEAGPDDFYRGDIARRLLADVKQAGGFWSESDLFDYQASCQQPLHRNVSGYDCYVPSSMGSGRCLLNCLHQTLDEIGVNDSSPEHFFSQVAKTSKQQWEQRWQSMGHASESACTSHISVMDAAGNAVSLTTTILSIFGSKFVSPSTGVLLNNGVYWLNPHTDHPNAIQGGVLPLNNMSPLVITKNNQAWCALGASGGRRIMPAMHQVLSLMMGKGLALDQAIAYPRIDTSESGRVICDPRLSSSIQAALKPYGEVVTWPAIANPHAYAIVAGVMKISHDQGLMAAINPYLPLTTAAAY